MEDLERVRRTAEEAARAGGAVAVAMGGDVGYLKWKGTRDPFVERSLEVQQAVVETILAAYPDAAILTEEGDDDEVLPLDSDPLWIVDPICGSMNYLQGDPNYAVCVGYREADFWQVGAVYEAPRNTMYAAIRGERATLDQRVISVEQIADGTEAIERALIGVDWPGGVDARQDMGGAIGMLAPMVMGVRALGSPALGLCQVAAGRFHGYVAMGLKLWDLAPASVILQAAGGVLTNGSGASWLFSEDGSCVASNAVVHGRLLTTLAPIYAIKRIEAERLSEAAQRAGAMARSLEEGQNYVTRSVETGG